MKRNYSKVRGGLSRYLTERIGEALYEMNDITDVEEIILDRPYRHRGLLGIRILGNATLKLGKYTVRAAINAREGFGYTVELTSKTLTGARNVIDDLWKKFSSNPERLFPLKN